LAGSKAHQSSLDLAKPVSCLYVPPSFHFPSLVLPFGSLIRFFEVVEFCVVLLLFGLEKGIKVIRILTPHTKFLCS